MATLTRRSLMYSAAFPRAECLFSARQIDRADRGHEHRVTLRRPATCDTNYFSPVSIISAKATARQQLISDRHASCREGSEDRRASRLGDAPEWSVNEFRVERE